jgi:PKD domain/Fibronectin type III domain/Divergent InlB B-repeat domain
MWSEYQCTVRVDESYWPPDICWGSLCEPSTCWGYPHNCYAIFEQRTDHFVWDGTGVVFYGQAYEIAVENGGGPSFSDALFWDGPTARWYSLVPRHVLTVSTSGVGSGLVTAFPGGIDCGDTCRASYPAGTEIVVEVQPDPTFAFAGWSGHCSGRQHYCRFWIDRDRSVTAAFGPVSIPPTAAFDVTCVDLSCTCDATTSTDPDGAIGDYTWNFGDATTTAGATAGHTYAAPGSYTVNLFVSDDKGLGDHATQDVTVQQPVPLTSTTTTEPPTSSTSPRSTTSTSTTSTSTTSTTSTTVPTRTVPGVPRSVTARAIAGTGEVRFSAPLSDGGSSITGYTARCASSNGGVTRQARGPASPVNMPSLSRGKTYTCTVRATNAVGTGQASAATTPFRVPR